MGASGKKATTQKDALGGCHGTHREKDNKALNGIWSGLHSA